MQGSGGGPRERRPSEQLERVDAAALRDQLDAAFRLIRAQPRPVAEPGTVKVRREFGPKRSRRARIDPDGRFALPTLRLRKVANNSFILDFDAPPNAPRKAYFSAICLDCLAGTAPPSSAN